LKPNKISKICVAGAALIAAALLVRCTMLGQSSKAGRPPGLIAGALAPCPAKPNCVCSEFPKDAAHYIEPIDYSDTGAERAWADIQRAIEELGGEVTFVDGEYLAATFSSSIFGFVDDVECRLDAPRKRIQIRSASRVGYSDLGVNRKRVEAIKSRGAVE
jgi:uncharacterized protein (DUF1499 family)